MTKRPLPMFEITREGKTIIVTHKASGFSGALTRWEALVYKLFGRLPIRFFQHHIDWIEFKAGE